MTKVIMSKTQWLLVLFFSIVIFLTLDLNGYRNTVSSVTIEPTKDSKGSITVTVYGPYFRYLYSGWLRIPRTGWVLEKGQDSKKLTAAVAGHPLEVYSEGEPIQVGLLHNSKSGIAKLVDGTGLVKEIDLHSDTESVTMLTIGGPNSDVISIRQPPFPIYVSVFVYILIFSILASIARRHDSPLKSPPKIWSVKRCEIVWFAIPFLISTTLALLAYWPGNVSKDGSLQWYQAATRGNIDPLMGISSTLFFRVFTYFSHSPAWPILFQSVLSGLGIAMILYELRHRGVSRLAAQVYAFLVAILPQYPLFFTNLGKDGLSAVGVLFVTWAALAITRQEKPTRIAIFPVITLVIFAVFAAMMRINVLPSMLLTVVLLTMFFFIRGSRLLPIGFLAAFLLGILFVPKIMVSMSDERQSAQSSYTLDHSSPLDFFNVYVYHLFSAAAFSGLPLDPSESELFYSLAPREAWQNYTCSMTDTTFTAVTDGTPLNATEYSNRMNNVRHELARSVFRIVLRYPAMLFERQKCITELLWYIGFRKTPFQTTATYGYENVDNLFLPLAGENNSLISNKPRVFIQKYMSFTESPRLRWLIWRPALLGYVGLFCALLYLSVRRDIGILLMLCLPVTLTLVMLVVIPFPAYRYQFPATLLFSLLCLLPSAIFDRSEIKYH